MATDAGSFWTDKGQARRRELPGMQRERSEAEKALPEYERDKLDYNRARYALRRWQEAGVCDTFGQG